MNTKRTGTRVAWVHATSGALLAAFVILHLWELSAATSGREAFAARAAGWGSASSPLLVGLFLGVPLLAHALAGALRARSAGGHHASYPSVGARRLQWFTALLVAAFLVLHLAHVWGAGGLNDGGARAAYDLLRADLGRPGWMSAYLVGVGAVSLHLAGGLCAALDSRWGSISPQVTRLRRLLVHVGAAMAFLVASHQLGYFAAGAGTFAQVQGDGPRAPALPEAE